MSINPFSTGLVAVHTYTRAQALTDGVLMDLSCFAKMVGFKHPVAVTSAVWEDCVMWDNDAEIVEQSDVQRAWDLIRSAHLEFSCSANETPLYFELLRVQPGGSHPTLVELILHVGSGDHGEPVITIMKPGED
jgi:hypothetical protein